MNLFIQYFLKAHSSKTPYIKYVPVTGAINGVDKLGGNLPGDDRGGEAVSGTVGTTVPDLGESLLARGTVGTAVPKLEDDCINGTVAPTGLILGGDGNFVD